MAVRRGEDWGTVGVVPTGVAIVRDDRELSTLINTLDSGATPSTPPVVQLLGGDLARTLGVVGQPPVAAGTPAVLLPVDLARVSFDGAVRRMAAHVVARRSWWHGPVVGVFNAQFLGRWDVAPRSHPGDGRLDVVEVTASMPVRQRWAARSRLPTAQHLPHPQIASRSVREARWHFDGALVLWIDGTRLGPTTDLQVEVEPGALTVCVAAPRTAGDAPGRG